MNLIILTETDRIGDKQYRLSDHRAGHILAVLKLEVGDTVEVGLLNGPQGRARLESIDNDRVDLVCEELAVIPAPTPQVNLVCALPRPQTLKKILITSAMMGVRALHLVRANRVEKSYFQSPLIQPENQLPFLLEGLSQGKLTRVPDVQVHDRFRPFFEDRLSRLDGNDESSSSRLLCSTEDAGSLDTVFDPGAVRVTVAIGPEGGWVPFEIELMQSVGFKPFLLGRWTLRVEHAVTAALSQLELLRMMEP